MFVVGFFLCFGLDYFCCIMAHDSGVGEIGTGLTETHLRPAYMQVGPSPYKRVLVGTLNVPRAHDRKDYCKQYRSKHDAAG